MAEERLQKILARAGVASRRAAEEIILAGRVTVNGKVIDRLGSKADPAAQKITVDGRLLTGPEAKEYWLVNKPVGVVSTVKDPEGRRRVLDLLPPEARGRLYPVGRLDYDSEGLLVLTNDGELAYRLMHPRFGVPKVYRVWVAGRPSPEALEHLRNGVEVDGRRTAPAKVRLKSGSPYRSKLALVIYEGRKREVRKMLAAVGHPVERLIRTGLGSLRLGELPVGAVRRLSSGEVAELKRDAGQISGCKGGLDGVGNYARERKACGPDGPAKRDVRHKGR